LKPNSNSSNLKTCQIGLGLAPDRQGTVSWHVLDVDTIVLESSISSHLCVVFSIPLGETELFADINLLASRELKFGTSESLNTLILKLVMRSDRDKNLSNLDSGSCSMSFTESSSHSSLEPISSSARQHFVDPKNVEGVDTHSDVELILATVLDEILVAADTGSLKCLARQLFQLIGHQVNRQREFINASLFTTEIEDPNLGVGYTTVEPTLWVGFILAVAIALGWSPTHDLKNSRDCIKRNNRMIIVLVQLQRYYAVSIAVLAVSSVYFPFSFPKASARPFARRSRIFLRSLSIFSLIMTTLLG